MNGRVYDPVIGRMMSVDPIFQAPTNTQSVNPYSYVMNNPLSLVDPSGYCGTGTDDGASQCQTDGADSPTKDRLYKGHNDTGTMDHLGGEKLAHFDKALGNANAALKAVFGDGAHVAFDARGSAVAAVNGNGAQVQQKIDIALSDQGKSAADKGGQSSAGDIATSGTAGSFDALQRISGMSAAQIDASFAGGDPADMVADNSGPSHPLGYYLPSIPEPVADFAVGLADGASFNIGRYLRNEYGIGTDQVDEHGGAYAAGSWSSLLLGVGRLGYAGAAKGVSILARTGEEASAIRTSMRYWGKLGMGAELRAPNLAKYTTDEALRAAAGRTNPLVNAYGAGMTATAAYNLDN